MIECEFCSLSCKTKYLLKAHLNRSKKCLAIRGLSLDDTFSCTGCNSVFATSANLTIHQDSCKEFAILILSEKYNKQIQTLKDDHEQQKKDLQQKLELAYTTIENKEQKLELAYATIENKEQKLELAYAAIENEEQKLKIQRLNTKYVKKKPRVEYPEQDVIYILTTPSHKKERKYILGKTENLTNRLTTYNKTDEHEVIYYQSCPEESMDIVEKLVFQKLKVYRERANRERFILPEGAPIELFVDVIKRTIEFIN